jgi:hypothetical protein
MRLKNPARSSRNQVPVKALAIVAVLLLGLLGGLLHHHESAKESDACSYCHAGFQTPVIDLARALIATTFAAFGFVVPAWPAYLPQVHFSTIPPRSPPATTHPELFWECCAGLA